MGKSVCTKINKEPNFMVHYIPLQGQKEKDMINREEKVFGNIKVVQRSDYKWGVVDSQDNEIVPFGKYDWIDSFEQGLCRVRSSGKLTYTKNIIASVGEDNVFHTDQETIRKDVMSDFEKHPETYAKWGIINMEGEEVLPVVYDSIWNFVGKNRFSTKVINKGTESEVYFHDLNPTLPVRGKHYSNSYDDSYCEHDYEESHYEKYAGTYAQDVAGYSDEDIDNAFDGNPDAYWNID